MGLERPQAEVPFHGMQHQQRRQCSRWSAGFSQKAGTSPISKDAVNTPLSKNGKLQ